MTERSATSDPKGLSTPLVSEDLRRRDGSTKFYEDRFSKGYVDEWPLEKKRRIREVIRSLGLPDSGIALDYGCGNGVLTAVLQEALPNWTIEGGDLSGTAVANSSSRYPHLRFYVLTEGNIGQKKYDFVFTHHVLEHVYGLDRAWKELIGLLKPNGSMLHILPCGNPGSLEHRLCVLRTDGIDLQQDNRFFFEDEGHLRRLSTNDLARRAAASGFHLTRAFYANQYHGAIDWVTASPYEFVLRLTEVRNATDGKARVKLRWFRWYLTLIAQLRQFFKDYDQIRKRSPKALKHVVFLVGAWGLFVVSNRLDRLLKRLTAWEWQTRKTQPNGSEMYLYFSKA
jgi:trans-aconitate methyltransferase